MTTRILKKNKPICYVASPVAMYTKPIYNKLLHQIQSEYGDFEVVPARGLYGSMQQFREKWPTILPSIGLLIFISDKDNTIGRGVWIEIHDALSHKIPVMYMTYSGDYVPMNKLKIELLNDGASFTKYAVVHVVQARGQYDTFTRPPVKGSTPTGHIG